MKNPFEKRPAAPKEESPEEDSRRASGEMAGAAALVGLFGGGDVEKPAMPPEEIERLSESARTLAEQEQQLIDGWSPAGDAKDADIATRHGRFADYEEKLRAALAAGDETQAKRSLLLMELALDDVRKSIT